MWCGYGSRHLQKIWLFCKTALLKRLYFAKETYNSKEPTNRIHPVAHSHTPYSHTRPTAKIFHTYEIRTGESCHTCKYVMWYTNECIMTRCMWHDTRSILPHTATKKNASWQDECFTTHLCMHTLTCTYTHTHQLLCQKGADAEIPWQSPSRWNAGKSLFWPWFVQKDTDICVFIICTHMCMLSDILYVNQYIYLFMSRKYYMYIHTCVCMLSDILYMYRYMFVYTWLTICIGMYTDARETVSIEVFLLVHWLRVRCHTHTDCASSLWIEYRIFEADGRKNCSSVKVCEFWQSSFKCVYIRAVWGGCWRRSELFLHICICMHTYVWAYM